MMMDPSEHLLSSNNDPLAIGSSSSSTAAPPPTSTSMTEIADVDVYFKRLYSKTSNPPPISVDEFLDIMTRCKDSPIQREKDVFHNGIRNLFEEYKFYIQYPERELHLTAQLFGGLFERGLFQQQALMAAFRAIVEGLKKPTGSNLWNFAVTALDRCKARVREHPPFVQGLRNLPTYSEIPSSIRDYLEYGLKTSIQHQFEPLRTLTPTSNLPMPTAPSPQPQMSHSPMNVAAMFPRMNSGPPIANPQQYTTGNSTNGGGVGRENPAQKGPSLTQNANIRTLMSDPSYQNVRVKPPPEQINDKVAFTFNNLSFANLSQKAEELKDVLGNDDQLWKWVAQYLVIKRASIEPNFHSLYAGFINTINVNILHETVLTETHRNIQILLSSDKQINNIPDRALLKNLGHWLGIITIAKNKPILATDLEIKSIVIEAYHMGSQELLYIVPFVAKILESCTRSKIFQQPNPWLMGIMSVLAEMHATPDFKLNLKFEIEVLCRQLQIQLADLPIHHILVNKEYFEKIEKQLSTSNRQSPVPGPAPVAYQSQQLTSLYNDPAILNYHQLPSSSSTATSNQQQQSSTVPSVPKYKLSDFKPSILQSLSSMLEINPNIPLFQHHPRLKTYIHSPIEQAINESLQTVQRSLKVASSAAETIVRKDFLLNPDEQQLRTSARNMVAYLSSGLVLITARPALQDQIQSYIKTHFQTVLGVPQAPAANSSATNTGSDMPSTGTTSNGISTGSTDQLSTQTRDMIQQAATEIAASNIELCCCLLQRITIHRAIQLIDQRLASDIEVRQRCRLEGRQLPTVASVAEFQSDRLLEPIRLRYGPLSSHQLAIYEDFVHFIPGFKPSDNEKRDLVSIDETGPSVWDRLVAEIDQTIQTQHNQIFSNALQRLLESVNVLRTNLHNQSSITAPQAALNNVLNIIIYNLLEHYTTQSQSQEGENLERFKNVHMSVLKLLVEIRLHMSLINKQLTKAWLDCPNELKFNVHAVSQLIRNRLIDIRQMDGHVAQLIDSGSNPALHFAVNFLRNCVIEQPCCVDSDIASILESLHRISLIGKQPAEAVRDLLEIIRLNYTSLAASQSPPPTATTTTANNSNESNSTSDSNGTGQSTAKIDKLAIISLSVISNGHKYLSSSDEMETATIANKAKHILSDWVTLTMTQTNRISQQQSFQGVFNQMNMQGLFRSDDTIAKFLRLTIQLCVNSVYDIIRQAPPVTSSSSTQQAHYTRCHQGIDSLCRFLSLLTTHTSDSNNYGARIHLINRILGILAAHCFADHEEQGDQFHPLAYQRIILNLFQESTAAVTSTMSTSTPGTEASSANEHVMYYIYLAFTNCLHLLRPQRVPGFAFAWLEIVAHRTFMSRLLLSGGRFTRQTHHMYALLLVDALRLVTPFIRSGEHAQSFQVYFKGILKTFMLLLHDFPEFLCEHYYQFCDALPLIAHQLRNIVLSAFPKQMRCPDPFLVNFKVDMLNDISIVPVIAYNFSQNIQPPKFKQNLDSYLRTRAPVTFLSELRSYLQQGADPGSHYNIRMLNALVLYVATQALSTLNNKTNGQPLMSSITHSAHMDIFQNLAVDLDTEGRYIFLNAMANHLRYPNTHTHYFSYTLLYLFSEANSEALQEQIVRVLLERLVANRPHPWGLLLTFLELVRNPNLKLWSREFMNISPDVKRLLTTLTRGFPHIPTAPISAQQQQATTLLDIIIIIIKKNPETISLSLRTTSSDICLMLFRQSSYRFVNIFRCYSSKPTLTWPSSRVRQTFIDYFTKHSQMPHTIIPSSSVIPPKDSGTYFVNSGMNQFKNIFLSQQESHSQQCVVNYQKCIRVGGKHNDLSDVGHDTYHHTFFEMLGNWAFNNAYFKRQACTMAYDLLTRVYGIEQKRLFFTYFQGEKNLVEPDYETKQIWMDLGVAPERILPFGMKENFWEMGEIGPCGPCTEIHYDHTGQADPSQVNRDNPKVVEIWNLVFMQYERRQDKSLLPLTNCHIDTGMGLERLVAVLNSSESNYDTDLFTPLFDTIHSYCPNSSSIPIYSQANKNQQYAYRLLADHARMFTIAIGDGLIPEKKGIGGLLKKMIERATRIAHEYLNIDGENRAVLSKLIPVATQILSPAYPDLKEKLDRTVELVKYCEINYMKKYRLAKPLLERFIQEKVQASDYKISGTDIHRLYAGKIDGINVPIEMIEDYTRLHPLLQLDWTSFEELMREETRKSKLFSVYNKTIKANQNLAHHPTDQITDLLKQSPFVKATTDEPHKYQADRSIQANLQLLIEINSNNQLDTVQTIKKDRKYYILLDQTSFYSTSGGQSSDHGKIEFSNNQTFEVENVFRLHNHILHYGSFLQNGEVQSTKVSCHVDMNRRLNLSRNHTTTHLVNKILREILNDSNLIQKASLIHEDYFIFEYSSINLDQTNDTFDQLEKRVNEMINLDLPVTVGSYHYDSIRSDPNIYRLSNEFYPAEVRCVKIGSSFSQELCCGTHVPSTKQIEDFLLVRVDSKGQSNKRLYCLTGSFAKHARDLFENDFKENFQRLEENQNRMSVDQIYSLCRTLYVKYLEDKSLSFPQNQRAKYLSRWHRLIPDKKLLRKSLLNQLNEDSEKNFIQSDVDLPIYEIGYMLLRYNDETNCRQHQPYVVYVNYHQNICIIYLKNPRQREHLIEQMTNEHQMNLISHFDNYDQQTKDLFTSTKKLVVFQQRDNSSFDRLDFQRLTMELFSNVF